MALKRWIAVLAALGMLIHAGVVVRHAELMLAATLQASAPATGPYLKTANQEAPCPMHAAAGAPAGGTSKPASTYKCPICAGVSAAVAGAELSAALAVPDFVRERQSVVPAFELTVVSLRLWPPYRGPPSSIA